MSRASVPWRTVTDAGAEHSSPLRPDAVDPGTNVLIVGPAMTGKRRLVLEVLCGSRDRTSLFVSTKESAASVETAVEQTCAGEDWQSYVIDCVSRARGVEQVSDTPTRRHVGSAGDLTGIGIEATGFMQDFYHDPDVEDARVGIHTLSTMLMYADLRRVYQFVHVMTGRLASSGFVGAVSLDTTSHDDEPVARLKGLFDVLVEVRDTDAGRELRVRGGQLGPGTWTPY